MISYRLGLRSAIDNDFHVMSSGMAYHAWRCWRFSVETRCSVAKPDVSPPGCATSRLRPVNQFCG